MSQHTQIRNQFVSQHTFLIGTHLLHMLTHQTFGEWKGTAPSRALRGEGEDGLINNKGRERKGRQFGWVSRWYVGLLE
jgi:hypothetical protein